MRSLEIIGEATKKVSPETRHRYPAIDRRAMAGMRDRLIHDYFGVDYIIVWDVAHRKIPALRSQKEVNNELGDELGVANALFNLANQIRFFGERTEAMKLVRGAKEVATKFNDHRLLQRMSEIRPNKAPKSDGFAAAWLRRSAS